MSLVQGYSSSSSYSDDGDGDKETMPKPELIDDSIKSTEFKSNSSLIKKIDAAPNLPSISNENSSTDSLPANFLLMKNSNVESEIFQKYGPQLEGDRLGKNNIFTGHVENAFQSSGAFQKGRLDFDHYGKAADPSAPLHLLPPSFHEITEKPPIDVVYDRELLAVDGNHKEFVKLSRRQLKKARRKIHTNKDHQDIENFTGPFGKYEDEITVARPSYEDKLILEEYLAKREKKASSKNYVKKEDSFTKHSANNEEKVMKINDVFYCSDFRTSLAKRNELPKRV
ncbi:MAG: pre-mRNA-processing factor 17, partial [Marteilia pararefringens]